MTDRYAEVSAIEQSVIDALGMATAGIEPIGDILRNARESANLSQRDVADKMFLWPNQVEALETGDRGRFRGDFFYNGYLRSYAKLMKLDPQVVSSSCEREQLVSTEAMREKATHQHIQSPRKGRSIKYWFLAVIVLVGYFLWWVNAEKDADSSFGAVLPHLDEKNTVDEFGAALANDQGKIIGDVGGKQILAGPENLDSLREDGPIRAKDSTVSFVALDKNIQDASVTTIQKIESKLNPDKAPAIVESKTNETTGFPSGAVAGNSLIFNFINDCWVEVRDRDNKIIFADLKRAEETLNLLGRAPFQILLGFAPGVSLAYNGKPVDIVIDKSNNSARLTVGRS